MIGNHGYQIVLDNYVKGLRDFDVTAAYEGMREEVSELCTLDVDLSHLSIHHTCMAIDWSSSIDWLTLT